MTGFPAIALWESTLVKELLFNRNKIPMASIMLFEYDKGEIINNGK